MKNQQIQEEISEQETPVHNNQSTIGQSIDQESRVHNESYPESNYNIHSKDIKTSMNQTNSSEQQKGNIFRAVHRSNNNFKSYQDTSGVKSQANFIQHSKRSMSQSKSHSNSPQ